MSDLTQPVHLFVGDRWMQGRRNASEAAEFNADDATHPIYRVIGGGTHDTRFVLPSPIVDDEWSLEHVLAQIAHPGFELRTTPANVKVTEQDATFANLLPGGSLAAGVEEAMARVLVEPMFADLQPRFLYPVNGSFVVPVGTIGVVHPNERLVARGVLETEGFVLRAVPSFDASSGPAGPSGAMTLLSFSDDGFGSYRAELFFDGISSTFLRVHSGLGTVTSAALDFDASDVLFVCVDWRGDRMFVVNGTTRRVLAERDIGLANWSGKESEALAVGSDEGVIDAPSAVPHYAAPRCDLIVVQMGEALEDLADPEADAEVLVSALASMRARPWGAGAPVWLILPAGASGGEIGDGSSNSLLGAREAMLRAAAALDNVSAFETWHLPRSSSGGMLTGEGILELSRSLSIDAQALFAQHRRTMSRPRRPGYRHFASEEAADAFVEELIAAGAGTRELSPVLGGAGQRTGDGVQVPWPTLRTQRETGDHDEDPNTNERLVPVDLRAADLGFDAAAAFGTRIVPSGMVLDLDSASPPGSPLGPNTTPIPAEYMLAVAASRDRAMLFDPLTATIEKTSLLGPLLARAFGVPGIHWTAGGGADVVSTSELDPAGGTSAARLEDTGASEGRVTGPFFSAVLGSDVWAYAAIRVDEESESFPALFVEQGGVLGPGVSVDLASGRASTTGTVEGLIVQRFGEWLFLAFKFAPTSDNVRVSFAPARGEVASWPSASTSAQGGVTVWGAGLASEAESLWPRYALGKATVGNLVTSSTWTPSSGCTVTPGQPDPKGGSEGVRLEDTDSGALGSAVGDAVPITPGNELHFSIAVRRDESQQGALFFPDIGVAVDGSREGGILFDLFTGEVRSSLNVTALPTSEVDGWFIVQFKFTPVAGSTAALHIRPRNSSLVTGAVVVAHPRIGDVTADPAVGDAMAPAPIVNVTPYVHGTSPRVLRSGRLFCEGARQNQIASGVDLAAPEWTGFDVTVERASEPAPDRSVDAWRVSDLTIGARGYITTPITLGSGVAHTLSAFFRRDFGLTRLPALWVETPDGSAVAQLNTRTGETGLVDEGAAADERARATLVLDEEGVEWWRLELTLTPPTGGAAEARVLPASSTVFGTLDDGSTGSTTVALVQFEEGEFASTPIPTDGAAFTRAADAHVVAMGAPFRTLGFFVEYIPEHDSGQGGTMQLVGFAGSPDVGVWLHVAGGLTTVEVRNGAVSATTPGFAFERGDVVGVLVSFDGAFVGVLVNGAETVSVGLGALGDWSAVTEDPVMGAGVFGSLSSPSEP